MPYILHGGVTYTQVRHAIQCKKCLETIESKDVHDYRVCSCKSVAIDGGINGRILGNTSEFYNRSVYRAIIQNKIVYLKVDI